MMCAPRSAVPEVATAMSLPAATAAMRRGSRGSAMPIRHCCPGAGEPAAWMSPPPLTQWFALPWPRRIALARSTAQPLTIPVGSGAPRQPAVNRPRVSRSARSHSASTSRTRGSAPVTLSSPRRTRETSLSRE
jgi:hypothetical protein